MPRLVEWGPGLPAHTPEQPCHVCLGRPHDTTLAAAIDVVAASGPFWSSETSWAAAGVVVGAGVGAAGVYAIRRAAFRRRSLVYSFSSTSLVQRHQRNVSANVLHIRLGERKLTRSWSTETPASTGLRMH
jgi:hypothetical protein